MTPAEAAALLTVAAAYDNRRPDADQARAWAMALDGLRFEDCRDAIVAHYRESRDWMMPVDVIGRVRRVRNDRVKAYGVLPVPPSSIDPDDTAAIQQWRLNFVRGIADGEITTDNPQLPNAPGGGPWADGPSPELAAADAAERIKSIRATLARRAPTPERPTFAAHAATTTIEETP